MTKQGTTASLKRVQESLQSCIPTMKGSDKRVTYITALSSVSSAITESINTIPVRGPNNLPIYPKTKKKLKILANTIEGISNGVETSDLSLVKTRNLVRRLIKEDYPNLWEAFNQDQENEVTRMSQKKSYIEDTGRHTKTAEALSSAFEEAEKQLRKHLKELEPDYQVETERGNKEDDQVRIDLLKLKLQVQEIPKDIGKEGYTFVRAPVVPTFRPTTQYQDRGMPVQGYGLAIQPNPSNVLKEVGIKYLRIDEYTIIKDQLLLVILKHTIPYKDGTLPKDTSVTQKEITLTDRKKLTDIQKRTQKASITRDKNAKLTPLDYAQTILMVYNEMSNTEFVLVDDKPALVPTAKDALAFWIMPAKKLSFLLRKRFPKIVEWGIPNW